MYITVSIVYTSSFSGFCGFLFLLCLIGTFIDWAKEAFSDPTIETHVPSDNTLNAYRVPSAKTSLHGVGQSNNVSHEKDVSEATSADTHEKVDDVEHGVLNSDNVELLPSRRYTQCCVLSKVKGIYQKYHFCDKRERERGNGWCQRGAKGLQPSIC